MIRYSSSSQLIIAEIKTPFQTHLDSQNRWVKLAAAIPWNSLASADYQHPTAHQRPGKYRNLLGKWEYFDNYTNIRLNSLLV